MEGASAGGASGIGRASVSENRPSELVVGEGLDDGGSLRAVENSECLMYSLFTNRANLLTCMTGSGILRSNCQKVW